MVKKYAGFFDIIHYIYYEWVNSFDNKSIDIRATHPYDKLVMFIWFDMYKQASKCEVAIYSDSDISLKPQSSMVI